MQRYGLSPDICHFIMNHRAGRDPEYLALFLSLGSIVYQLFSSIDDNKERSMRCTASQLSQLLLPSTNYYLVPISTHVVSKAAKFFMLQNFHLCWLRGFIFERSILYMVVNDPMDGGRSLGKGLEMCLSIYFACIPLHGMQHDKAFKYDIDLHDRLSAYCLHHGLKE